MKKNRFMRLASLLLIAVVLSACAISGTFAKYTTSSEASDSARVAKWAIQLNNPASDAEPIQTLANDFTFNLFETINDTKDGSDETDVADGLIAPGTKGEFAINLYNKSEVNATYAIDYTVSNSSNIPVQFSIDNGASWTNDLTDVGPVAFNMNGQVSITIQWKWAFEGNDATDTAFGVKGTDTIEVKAAITVTQVD